MNVLFERLFIVVQLPESVSLQPPGVRAFFCLFVYNAWFSRLANVQADISYHYRFFMRLLNFRLSLVLLFCLALTACSPTYDWREIRGEDAPYIALMPGKPSSHTRVVNLNGMEVSMTLTAAEVEDVVFAIGTAELDDASRSAFALEAMKTALIRNISGTVRSEKHLPAVGQPGLPVVQLEAAGTPAATGQQKPHLLLARLVAKDRHIYQVLVLGPEARVKREEADTFFSGFKIN